LSWMMLFWLISIVAILPAHRPAGRHRRAGASCRFSTPAALRAAAAGHPDVSRAPAKTVQHGDIGRVWCSSAGRRLAHATKLWWGGWRGRRARGGRASCQKQNTEQALAGRRMRMKLKRGPPPVSAGFGGYFYPIKLNKRLYNRRHVRGTKFHGSLRLVQIHAKRGCLPPHTE